MWLLAPDGVATYMMGKYNMYTVVLVLETSHQGENYDNLLAGAATSRVQANV